MPPPTRGSGDLGCLLALKLFPPSAWFDISSLDDVNQAEDKDGMDASVTYVNSLLDEELRNNAALGACRRLAVYIAQRAARAAACS